MYNCGIYLATITSPFYFFQTPSPPPFFFFFESRLYFGIARRTRNHVFTEVLINLFDGQTKFSMRFNYRAAAVLVALIYNRPDWSTWKKKKKKIEGKHRSKANVNTQKSIPRFSEQQLLFFAPIVLCAWMENEILEKFLCFPVSEVGSQISNFSSYFVWHGLGQVNSGLGTTLFASLRFVGEIKFSRRFSVFQLMRLRVKFS